MKHFYRAFLTYTSTTSSVDLDKFPIHKSTVDLWIGNLSSASKMFQRKAENDTDEMTVEL